MARSGESFESFHEGLNAGHEAGKTQDVLYAFGFVVGFIWGALASARRVEPRVFERADRTA